MRESFWFRIPLIGKYFAWLEGDSPTGPVDAYPVLNPNGESEIPGIYIAGDLTGIPLLKFAADSGNRLVLSLLEDEDFQKERNQKARGIHDLIIVGAGISGVSAAITAQKHGLNYLVIESDKAFSTIGNFPPKKPITAYPEDAPQDARLRIIGETKEELLDSLLRQANEHNLSIVSGSAVVDIKGSRGNFQVQTKTDHYRALRIIIATGKGGESRKLGVPGEDLYKVQNRMIDPLDYQNQKVLIVGGGDTAVENALLISEAPGTDVTLSYRGEAFSRPKIHNIDRIKDAESKGRIRIILKSYVKRIEKESVLLSYFDTDRSTEISNDRVLVLIGKKLPVDLFRRIGISIEGSWNRTKWILLAALAFFSGVLYFGKSAPKTPAYTFSEAFIRAPSFYFGQSWEKACLGILAWASLAGFLVTGTFAFFITMKNIGRVVSAKWNIFKSLYFFLVSIFISYIFITEVYMGVSFLSKSMGFWYSSLYTLTILIFGIRRVRVRSDRYITLQTLSLIGVQIGFLFLLPEWILPWLGDNGMLNHWATENLFPNGSYWRSYGFILAWPLFFSNLFYGQPTTVWLLISLVQTFIIIPALVWTFGKGAYCGWICSCGGLAETLGDEYRKLALHGPKPRSLEHVGQVILFIIAALTLWNLSVPKLAPSLFSELRSLYKIIVDVCLAGVAGVGAYFFLSGRVWCRFFCPLAALMHIYTKFSKYRILSDKKKCISCGNCTRVCHMGIDVMNFANKGYPMGDYECVRCSACIVECPVDCLRFGTIEKV